MVTAIAIDDEPNAIEVIKHHTSKIDTIQLVAHFHNAHDAISFLKNNPIDSIFLDINMPHMSGLEMLKELKLKPLIIFTTAYAEFAVDSYTYNAVDYLLKPFEFERFSLAVQKLENALSSKGKQKTFFFVKDGIKGIKIAFNNILFIKGSGNYLDIHTREKIHSPRMTFTEIVGLVPAINFVRIHQSYIINIANIDKIENNHIHIGAYKIPISNRYRESFLKCIGMP